MADNTELLIRIRADVRQALDQLKDVSARVDATGKSGQKAGAGLQTTGRAADKAARELGSAGTAAGRASDRIGRAGRAGRDAATGIRRVGTESSRTSPLVRELKGAVIGLFAVGAIKQFAGALVNAQVELQRVQLTLEAATGSAAAAGRELAFVRGVADDLGTNFQTSAAGYAQLAAAAKAANVPLGQQRDLFVALARASSVLGLSTEKQGRAIEALSQVLSKGNLSAEELRQQLGEAIPGLVGNFANALGVTGQQLNKLLQQGSLVSRDILPALITAINDVAPDNALTKSVNSTNASLSRMQTALFNARTQLASGGFIDAVTVAAQTVADVGLALNTTSGEADDSRGAFSGVRVLLLELAKAAAATEAVFRKLGSAIAAVAAASTIIGGGADGKANSVSDFIPGYNAIKYRKQLGAIFDGLASDLSADQDKLQKQFDAINKLLAEGGTGERGGKPPNISDYTDRLKKLREQLKQALNGGSNGSGGNGSGSASGADQQAQVARAIDRIIQGLAQQRDTLGQTAEQVDIYRLRTLGASEAQIEQARTLVRSIQAQRAQQQANEDSDAAARRAAQAQAQFVEQIKNQIDPARQYRAQLVQLDIAYADGALSARQYAQAAALINQQIEDGGKKVETTTDALDQFQVAAARNIQDTIASALQFNKLDNGFKGLVQSAAKAFQQIAAQALALDLESKIFGPEFAQGKSASGGGLFAAIGDLVSGGGQSAGSQRAAPSTARATASRNVGDTAAQFADRVFSDSAAKKASESAASSAGGFFEHIVSYISGLFGGGSSSGGSSSGGLSAGGAIGLGAGLGSLAASFFHEGGLVAAGAGMQRSVPLSVFAGAPRLHGGGSIGLKPDEVPAVLQTGERVQSRAEVAAGRNGGPHTIKNILIDDQRRVFEHLAGPEGEQIVLQHVQRNADQVGQVVKGG